MLGLFGCLAAALLSAAPGDDPVEVYDARRVIVETVFVLDERGSYEVTPRNPDFRTGDGTPLDIPSFYAYVDRPDLVEAYYVRRTRRRVLFGAGLAMAATGVGLTLGYVGVGGRTGDILLGSGLSLLVGSAAPLAVSGFMSPHPVSKAELSQIARDKNRRLREQLGLPERLYFEPTAGRHGAGARISGRF